LLLSGFRKGDQMKTTLHAQPWPWPQPQIKPPTQPAKKLTRIKTKDYTLIGFRDLEAEAEIHTHLESLKSKFGFLIPRLYTLVSQNKKIPITKNLSNQSRMFLNFESFKWSELFFNFFRPILSSQTEYYAFKNVLYSLDIYICQYQLMIMAIKQSSQDFKMAIQRHKGQFQLLSQIRSHPHGENLCFLFILDLFLISIGRSQYASCAFTVNQAEALILLSYFQTQGLITVEPDKVDYLNKKFSKSLKKYFEFRGQILFTSGSEIIFSENQFSFLKNTFNKKAAELEHKTFETCFTHF